MKTITRVLALSAVCAMVAVAAPASAQTYNFTYGTSASGSFTANPTTGAIMGISGTLNGGTITGLIANPYTPGAASYDAVAQTVGSTDVNGYSFDNLVTAGGMLNNSGILFQTSTSVGNLFFESGSLSLITNDRGVFDETFAAGTGSITLAATPTAPAPEPATWAMMIVGFGLAGSALRRRSAVRPTVSYAV